MIFSAAVTGHLLTDVTGQRALLVCVFQAPNAIFALTLSYFLWCLGCSDPGRVSPVPPYFAVARV